MLFRTFLIALVAAAATAALAQDDDRSAPSRTPGRWRSPAGRAPRGIDAPRGTDAPRELDPPRSRESDAASGRITRTGGEALVPVTREPRTPITRVTEGSGVLPTDGGQVWREYDITPYVVRVTNTNRPEQAIVDWILRETGYEAWHSEPLGFLSANRRALRVYHTPQMQSVVAEVVDRFVNSEAETHAFGLRVLTVGHPDWRVRAKPMLRPVAVQTQGIQAWLLQKEDAALLLAELRKRTDFREHSSPHLLVNNGQSTTVATTRPRTYVRDITIRPDVWPPAEPELGQFDEGFSLELSPLLSLDGRTIDAVIKCNVDQLERLVPVMMDVPSHLTSNQRAKVEVPQVTHCRLHERFRWPTDQILLVGMGVVATPVPDEPGPLKIPVPWSSGPSRADLLVMVESRGRAGADSPSVPLTGSRESQTYRGRY